MDVPGTPEPPISPAEQLDWLLEACRRLPVRDDELRGHLAPAVLAAGGGREGVNAALAGLAGLAVHEMLASGLDRVQATLRGGSGEHRARVCVDEAGLVIDIELTPDEPPPTSWADVDAKLAGLAPRVSFAAAEIGADGRCRIRHGLDADTPRPIGSAFKMYVLGALGQATVDGRASWDELLTIREDHKSLPGGVLQDRPPGTPLTLGEYADHMISISDNTATDHLLHRLGRDAVRHQLVLFGHRSPRTNDPFLSTKAFFRLKAEPHCTRSYLDLPPARRAAVVEDLERREPPEIHEAWPVPREIDRLEWFASPVDICHAWAGLRGLGQAGIGHALSRNDEGLNLDSSRFPTVWYKGGSEPGVLTMHYLAVTSDGRVLAVSLMTSDPATVLDAAAVTVAGRSAVRAAFDLLTAPF